MDSTNIENIVKEDEQNPPSEPAVGPIDERTQYAMQDDLENRKVNLGVRYFNYRGFMNRMQNDNWDHTIECLLTDSNPRDEIDQELKRRKGFHSWEDVESGKHPLIAENPNELGENRRLFRVKIRSSEIIRHLAELSKWDSDVGSAREELVFCRPFHIFVFYHERMKERLEKMELDQAKDFTSEHEDISRAPTTALDEMRCYVTFVEQIIVPMWAQYDMVDEKTPKKVCYEEIPMLFRPGELVFFPSPQKATKAYHQSAIQNVFRMYFCSPLDTYYHYESGKWLSPPSEGRTACALYCLDHDGEGFRTLWNTVRFDYFSGERDIISLECFPLRFHPLRDQIQGRHVERGKAFKELSQADVSHLYYSGWNLVTGVIETEESKIEEPEHMESEVIIDIKEAERHLPEWANRDVPEITSFGGRFRIQKGIASHILWKYEGKAEDVLVGTPDQELELEDSTYFESAKEFNRMNPYIQRDGRLVKQWADEDYTLLPRRICGYVLRERKFARLDVQSFQSKADSKKVTLDDLQLKDGHRRIIRSSVSSHFLRSTQSKEGSLVHDPDIIRGKGRGLVILLHGAPGVGKTATAEAVALEFEKPLFPITCGDLGVTPDSVERTLKDIFRYAHLWDCILLLDEADVFLTQRDRINIERNALVSVFLRVLEYYSGILFLTTNRVGALDEAFRSRVHISLYYPHLSYDDTIAILQTNLARLPRADSQPEDATPTNAHLQVMDSQIMQYIQREYDTYSKIHRRGPWNGRQIRNAVQIAACLAFFEHKDGPKNLPAVLTAEHFRTVHATMTEFDTYMTKAQRADNSKMAHMAGDRFDNYGADVESREPVKYEGFADFETGRRSTPMHSAGRGTASTSSRGRLAQGMALRQNLGPGLNRGKYPGAPYAAGRDQVPYRPSPPYSEPPMEEEGEMPQKISIDPQERGRRPPLTTHGAMHMEDNLEDQFPDDMKYPEEQTNDYELHSSEDHYLEVGITATPRGYQNNRAFDQALDSIDNPSSMSRMSASHVNKKAGFQRQGYGA